MKTIFFIVIGVCFAFVLLSTLLRKKALKRIKRENARRRKATQYFIDSMEKAFRHIDL